MSARETQLRPEVRAWLWGELDAGKLLTAARGAAGTTGDLDAGFLDALRALVRAFTEEARLSDAGLLAVRAMLLRSIINRLRLERDLAAHPEIRAVPIARPVFIVGLPRTGTTLLHNLLAQDPASRSPALWEVRSPSPPPDPASRDTDPRIAMTDAYLTALYREAPALRQLHPMSSRAPDECNWILLSSLASGRLLFEYDIPSCAWLLTNDRMTEAYRTHRATIQSLVWRSRQDRVVLKDPFHLWHLRALLEVYPDARVVRTHRDPLEVLPSATRLCATLRSLSSESVSVPEVASALAAGFLVGLDREADVRARHAGSFHDVLYRDLVRDPVRAARCIYERFDLAWSADVELRMRRWLAETGHAERAGGRYEELSKLGLHPDEIRSRYAAYRERFLLRGE